ncbi:MAG: hypothetical protein ACTSW7_01150 [Candidatus Thorarchaeota archaeon]|nr:hypothetical protein [Thermoplasmatales archaeon]
MTVELIIGGNQVEVVKGSVGSELIAGDNEVVIERSVVHVEITKGEHEVLLVEPEIGSEQLDLNIEQVTPQVNIEQTEVDLDIVRDGIEVEIVTSEQLVEVLQGDVDIEIVAQPSIIHVNPEALPEEAFCSALEIVGDCVYIYDDKVTGKPVVRKCDIFDLTKMPAIAIITEKITTTECKIKKIGEVDGFGSFTSGGMVVVGSSGQPVHPPALPDPTITPYYVQVLGVASNPDTLLLHIDMTMCQRIR